MGCDEVVDYEDKDPVAEVRRSLGGEEWTTFRLHGNPGVPRRQSARCDARPVTSSF